MPGRLSRWLSWGRDPLPRHRVICLVHGFDLAALTRYVEDGRPDADAAASSLLAAGTCPACQPRYMAAGQERVPERVADGLHCRCCRTTWSMETMGWVARVGGGIDDLDDTETLPAEVTIDQESFRIAVLDDVDALEQVLRAELRATPAIAATPDPRVQEIIDDLVDGVVAAALGSAVEGAEIGRAVSEGHLDPLTSELLETRAEEILTEVHRLLDGAPSGAADRARATADDAYAPGDGVRMSREQFERLVDDALHSLPSEFADRLDNVNVVVADRRPDETLYGLYEGVPLTERTNDGGLMPDRITLYQEEICADCSTEAEVRDEVRTTLLHEFGHHFGIDDARLDELGY